MTRRAAIAVLLLACGAVSCGSASPKLTQTITPPERPRDTAQIAERIAGGRVGALVYMDRVRASPMAKKLDDAFKWRKWWEGTGLDLERDVDRVFGTSPSLDHQELGVTVVEVNVPLSRIHSAVDVLFSAGRLHGEWAENKKIPEARIQLRDGSYRALALVEPRWVVFLPDGRGADAARFADAGGFPDPIGAEAIVLFAFDPSHTLHGKNVSLDVPESIKVGVANVALTVEGGAEIGVDALSASDADAKRDAVELTRTLDEATSIHISALKIHFIDPIVFRADGDHVRGRRTMPVSELDQILAFTRGRPLPTK